MKMTLLYNYNKFWKLKKISSDVGRLKISCFQDNNIERKHVQWIYNNIKHLEDNGIKNYYSFSY